MQTHNRPCGKQGRHVFAPGARGAAAIRPLPRWPTSFFCAGYAWGRSARKLLPTRREPFAPGTRGAAGREPHESPRRFRLRRACVWPQLPSRSRTSPLVCAGRAWGRTIAGESADLSENFCAGAQDAALAASGARFANGAGASAGLRGSTCSLSAFSHSAHSSSANSASALSETMWQRGRFSSGLIQAQPRPRLRRMPPPSSASRSLSESARRARTRSAGVISTTRLTRCMRGIVSRQALRVRPAFVSAASARRAKYSRQSAAGTAHALCAPVRPSSARVPRLQSAPARRAAGKESAPRA